MAIDTESYYTQYGPMVLRRCRAMLKDEDRARDAMHDVFVKVLQNQSRLEDVAPSSLLYRIATNVCLNKIRSRGRRPETPDDELLSRIASRADSYETLSSRSLLRRVFSTQPDSSAEMAVMHLLDGMTLEEVARAFEMSVSGVRKRLRKLRGQVRELEAV